MPINYAPVIAVWNTNTLPTGVTSNGTPLANTMTTAQKLSAINGWTVQGANVDVSVSTVIGYLALNSKLLQLENYATNTSIQGSNTIAISAAKMFTSMAVNQLPITAFEMSNSSVANTVVGMLLSLEQDGNTGITNSDMNAILSYSYTFEPWWQHEGFPSPLSVMDLEANNCALIPTGTYGKG